MSVSRRRRKVVTAVGTLVLAGSIPATIGATASAMSAGGKNYTTAGTTYCDAVQQSEAGSAMPGMAMGTTVKTSCTSPAFLAAQKKLTAVTKASATSMASMPGMLMVSGSPPQQTVFQGPTNLARTAGGFWNTFAARVPGTVSAIHSVMLYNGKVLLMAGSGNIPGNLTAGKFYSYLWTPGSNTFHYIPTPYDMFCAGHTELSDGNILIMGGTTRYPVDDSKGNQIHGFEGSNQSYIFNVKTETYQRTGSMSTARWYPTAVTMGNNDIVVVGGIDNLARQLKVVTHDTDTVEKYIPDTGQYSKLPSMDFNYVDPSHKITSPSHPVPNYNRTFPQYAAMTLLANGKLFYSGESFQDSGVNPGVWDPTTGAYTNVGGILNRYQKIEGATVLLPPAQAQKVMIMGGFSTRTQTSSKATQIINLAGQGTKANPHPHYVSGPNMEAPKMFVGAVVLPDYTVMETNGSSIYKALGVNTAEDYNPRTNKWTVWNSPILNRMYHSEAFLLPTGQVAILGGQPLSLQFEMHISIYNPPYLFKGRRPTVHGTNQLTRNGKFQGSFKVTVAKGSKLAHMSLIRPSATTHSTDPDQRLVDLKFVRSGAGYRVQVPANINLTPAGWYMLFATDSVGRPSVAEWVHVS